MLLNLIFLHNNFIFLEFTTLQAVILRGRTLKMLEDGGGVFCVVTSKSHRT